MSAPMDMATKTKHVGKIQTNMLFVSGLPYSITNEKLGKIFSDIGPIKNCFVVKDKDSVRNKGYGYVRFSLFKDAEKAIDEVKYIDGRKVSVTFADRSRKIKRPPRSTTQILGDVLLENPTVPEHDSQTNPVADREEREPKHAEAGEIPKKQSRVNKARIIIRNLHFACDAATLQSKFQKFGKICDIHIPKKGPNGQAVGVGFVQFTKLKSAARAIEEMNTKKILGRVVAVDWVVDKDMLVSAEQNLPADQPGESHSTDDFDESCEDENDDSDDDVDEGGDAGVSDDSEEDDEDDDSDEDHSRKKQRLDPAQSRRVSDVKQGRTLFIRNVPFDGQEQELAELMSEYGQINYCLLVRDKDTGMCKGSAFVQFLSKDNADNCLRKCNTDDGCPTMDGRRLTITAAMDRSQASDAAGTRGREKTDRRNIHLLREGMIREGSQASSDLTKTDVLLRKKIEAQMKVKLKNPAVFISPTRLVVNNLPYSIDDVTLKAAMIKSVGSNGVKVTECRVMRHLSQVKTDGVARSMGYAFVEFADHQHALAALHNTNNTDVFNRKKKLIVHFSLENRNVLEFKRKRDLRAAMKQDLRKKTDEAVSSSGEGISRKKSAGTSKVSVVPIVKSNRPKLKSIFPSHSGPKVRHKPRDSQTRRRNVKTAVAKPKLRANVVAGSQKKRHSKPKKEIRDTFDSLVLKYKNKLMKNNE